MRTRILDKILRYNMDVQRICEVLLERCKNQVHIGNTRPVKIQSEPGYNGGIKRRQLMIKILIKEFVAQIVEAIILFTFFC